MKLIPNSQALIGMLEGGELNEKLTAKSEEAFIELLDMSNENPKVKLKAEINLKLSLEVANGMITITSTVTTKVPERPSRSSVYFLTESGKLSTEHPQQHDMFPPPRDVSERGR
ncbi:hypothetical protein [Agrobacterium rosae]|uniref:hypothetical protein n=1 Tax=Agrobacterium rosae TaxID=1972867 RepID=UPI003B9E31EE